jgi:hypothetical protein
MLGLGKSPRTHSQQAWDELLSSYAHLRLAAGHAADGATERVAPSYDKARDAAWRRMSTTTQTFSPLYDQMRVAAGRARKEKQVPKRRKWPMLVGLLAAGTAVGAVGAIMARRRRAAAAWDEYEPMPSIDDLGYSARSGGAKVSGSSASTPNMASAGRMPDQAPDTSARGDSGGSSGHR